MLVSDSIVLHSRRYGDTSRIVVLYTEALGKVSVVARGARTLKSSFGSALEPLTVGRVSIYHRNNRELHTLGNADASVTWKHLTSTLEHLEAGLALCQLILRTQPNEVPAVEVFDLVRSALSQLEESHEDAVYRIGVTARMHLATLMGFGMQFHDMHDASTLSIRIESGYPTTAGGYQLSRAAYEVLAQAPYQTVLVPIQDRLEVEAFLSRYFSHHLGCRI